MADVRQIAGQRLEDDVRRARRALDLGQDVVLRKLADHAREGFEANFRTHGAASGAKWAPLKPATVKSKARTIRKHGLQTEARAPLQLFGDLRTAFTQKGGAQYQRIVGDTLEFAIDQSRVNRHNRKTGAGLGTTKTGLPRKARGKKRYPDNIIDIHAEGKGRNPVRDPSRLGEDALRAMDDEVERYFDGIADIMLGLE